MDVDTTTTTTTTTTDPGVTSSGVGSVTVQLHTLVVLNISEHWTRNKVKENSTDVCVYGALLGKQMGHCIEICNSFELLLDDTVMSVNAEFYNTREIQCKQIYPDLYIVGWYTTGGLITEKDDLFNRQMLDLNESLLVLKLDPIKSCGEQLPVRIYESVIDNDGCVHFRQVTYSFATDETERIGVDSVVRLSMAGTDQTSSMTAEHLLSNYQAIQMLCKRIYLIRAYVSAVALGELPPNRARLREISALTKRLPLLSSQVPGQDENDHTSLDRHLFRQANDVSLVSLLASLTQGMHTLYDCMCKTTHAIDRRPSGTAGSMGMPLGQSSGFVRMSHLVGNMS